jgi:hypothetical protein
MSSPGQGNRRVLAATPGIGLALCLLLGGCLDNGARPLMGLNLQLAHTAVNRDPALSSDWLALIGGQGGRDQVVLVLIATALTRLRRELPGCSISLSAPPEAVKALALQGFVLDPGGIRAMGLGLG